MGNATKDHEDWKKKKGYGPILVVAVSLALLLSLYAGGYLGSGTNLPPRLHRDEKGMTNAVASSSSTSLVGSGTAQGGSSAYCKKNTGYNCGAVFPPDGDTGGHKGCCCRQEDGTGMKYNTCDSAKGYAYRGCNSCMGYLACFKTNNIEVGDSSCHGYSSCFKVIHDSTIGGGSCLGDEVCHNMRNVIIGKGSCSSTDGYSCAGSENVKIGNNSCNGGGVCRNCKRNIHTHVPDNYCNQGSTAGMTKDGYCRFCM